MKNIQYSLGTILTLTFIMIFSSCHEEKLFKKSFSEVEKLALTDQMTSNLIRKFGQGSVSEILVLKEAIKLVPEQADLWREIGVPYGKRGMAAEFHENYSKAVQYDPLNWQGWRGYMYLYFYRDYERAIKDFDALDVLTPGFVDYPQSTSIHFMRAVCYLQLNQYAKAIDYWDKHLEEELRLSTEEYIDSKTFLFQGITYLKMEDLKNAALCFEKGLKHYANNPDLWFWSSKLALNNGDLDKARQALDNAQIQFDNKNQNYRPYVEEFYQLYQSDIDELSRAISNS